MLAGAQGNRFAFRHEPASTNVVPGASSAEGSWTEIAAAADITSDIDLFFILLSAGSTSSQIKNHLLDIGIDPAGGTSYTAIISDIVCGYSAGGGIGGISFFFPLRIPAGASVGARIQGSNATAGTVNITSIYYGQPSRPEAIRVGQYSETIGSVGAGSTGVAFTPGNSLSKGAWTELGTTTRDLWWWQLGFGVVDSGMVQQAYLFDIAYGDATDKTMIAENVRWNVASAIEQLQNWPMVLGYCEVPAGATIYIRGAAQSVPDSGSHALVVGIGG